MADYESFLDEKQELELYADVDTWESMNPIQRERAISDYHKSKISNPSLGLGQWCHFVRWWDQKGSHREEFRSRALAVSRADEVRLALRTS